EIKSGSPDAVKTENSLAHPITEHNTHIIPASRLKHILERIGIRLFGTPSDLKTKDTANNNTKTDLQSTGGRIFSRL
ncbi:MAG TPA: hypothetical protein VFX10_06925, partial [Nitrospira sp.]|nr:hypothetical protein [Nitrospira sp.]